MHILIHIYIIFKQNVFNFAIINATMQSVSMVYMRTSDRLYMGPSVFQAIELYALEARTLLDSVSSVRSISLGLFIGISALLYVFFYHPMIWILNDDTKRIWYFIDVVCLFMGRRIGYYKDPQLFMVILCNSMIKSIRVQTSYFQMLHYVSTAPCCF